MLGVWIVLGHYVNKVVFCVSFLIWNVCWFIVRFAGLVHLIFDVSSDMGN